MDSPIGKVELTDERLRHIYQFHPEVRRFQKHFRTVLAQPDLIRRSVHDPATLIFYGRFAPAKKFLAIVVKTNRRNFILTAYLTHRIKHSSL